MGGFSKTSYRSRRAKGKRGQGDKFTPIRSIEEGTGGHMVRGPKGFQMVNRKQARQRLRSRWYENEDDKVGKKFTAKGARHPKRKHLEDDKPTDIGYHSDYKGPKYDPTVSNHERVFRQRIKSGRIKLDQGDQSNGK